MGGSVPFAILSSPIMKQITLFKKGTGENYGNS